MLQLQNSYYYKYGQRETNNTSQVDIRIAEMDIRYMLKTLKEVFTVLFIFSVSTFSYTTDTVSSVKSTQPQKMVVVITVEGTVDAGMAAYIARALRDAKEQHPDALIVLEMDTFGGAVDAAFQIVDTILNVTNQKTVSYVKTKAISAGALIALSSNMLYMKQGTTIGDVAPLMQSEEGPKMLGEKFQSPIRAKFRTLAKKNGYPETLTESMVSEGMEVYAVKFADTTLYLDSTEFADLDPARKKQVVSRTTVVKKGELLTMDDVEANKLGFSRASVTSLEDMLTKPGVL